jgi:hypothetical protein
MLLLFTNPKFLLRGKSAMEMEGAINNHASFIISLLALWFACRASPPRSWQRLWMSSLLTPTD